MARYTPTRQIPVRQHVRTIFESNGSFYINLPMDYIRNNQLIAGDKVVFEEPRESMDAELLIRRVICKQLDKQPTDNHP